MAAAAVVPGTVACFFFCGYTALHFPKSELVFGARSLHATVRSVTTNSLYELNPNILNPLLLAAFQVVQPWIFPVLARVSLVCAVIAAYDRRRSPSSRARRPAILAAGTALLITFTLGVHWTMFRFFQILLPQDRTALYLAPLGILVIGPLTTLCLSSPHLAGKIGGRILSGIILCLALSFLFSLRLTYFQEWKYDADVHEAYSVLSYYNHKYRVTQVPAHWRYSSALNFYRIASNAEDFAVFAQPPDGYPEAQAVYVLYFPEDEGFIRRSNLEVTYHGRSSDLVIAVRPQVLSQAAGPPGSSR